MAQQTHSPRQVCSNCDGHASVAVTLGGRDRSGHLRTVTAYCTSCHGAGTTARRTATASVGR